MRKLLVRLIGAALLLSLIGCASLSGGVAGSVAPASATGAAAAVGYDEDDLEAGAAAGETIITLQGDSLLVEGGGATVDGSTLSITSAGTYRISGTLQDGRILVNSEDADTVRLILDGVNLTSSTSAPIYIFNAEKTVITLADGTANAVTDPAEYRLDDAGAGEPDAAIFSNDDLTINGSGSLTVTANYQHGIASDDDLRITGGTLQVTAVQDGLRGRDSLVVRAGSIVVTAGDDGLVSNNDQQAGQGQVVIGGGSLSIIAGADGIQAASEITVSGGDVSIVAGGGSGDAVQPEGWGQGPWGDESAGSDASDTVDAARGVQAGSSIWITGGTLTVDSADDALHSEDALVIDGGRVTLAAGDDGIHAENALTINGGALDVTQSTEGLESKAIEVNDGTIHIVSSDDGMNASTGQGSLGGGFGERGDGSLAVSGGYVAVDATGDGLDVNGPITLTGGTLVVHGPTSNGNGAVDYTGSFTITGGTFVAVGSAGMAMGPTTDSTQPSLMLTYSAAVSAGTILHIESEAGQDLLTLTPIREYQSVVFSSSEIEYGATIVIYGEGHSTGSGSDGLSSGGSYTPGSELATVTVSDVVTYVGSYAGGFRGGAGGQPPPRPGG